MPDIRDVLSRGVPFPGFDPSSGEVSLFVISKTDGRLTQINLQGLTAEKRAELQRWKREHRLVFVVETSDQIFARTHQDNASRLATVGHAAFAGKSVSVVSNTDEETEELFDFINKIFEESVDASQDVAETKQEDSSKSSESKRPVRMDGHVVSYSGVGRAEQLIAKFGRELSKLTQQMQERFAEARRKEAKQVAIDAQKEQIKKENLKQEIRSEQIRHDEILAQEHRVHIIRDGKVE